MEQSASGEAVSRGSGASGGGRADPGTTQLSAGEHERAIAAYDTAREHFEIKGLDRDELERSAIHSALATAPGERLRGTLQFSFSEVPPNAVL